MGSSFCPIHPTRHCSSCHGMSARRPELLLRVLQLDELAFYFPAERILAEVDALLAKKAADTKVVSLENSGFGLFLYLAYSVDRLFRNYQVAWNHDSYRVQSYRMGYRTHSRLVLTQFGEVAVAYHFRSLRAAVLFMSQVEQHFPDFLLEIRSAQHEVFPSERLPQSPYFVKADSLSADVPMRDALLLCKSCRNRCQSLIAGRYRGYLAVNPDDNPFLIVIHNCKFSVL